jgi:hypothetical protein
MAVTSTCNGESLQGIAVRRIVLREDRFCPYSNVDGICHCVVRTCGDEIRGVVEVLSHCNQGFTLQASLEGMLAHVPSVEIRV